MDIIERFQVDYFKNGLHSLSQILDMGGETHGTYQAAIEEAQMLVMKNEEISLFKINKTFVVTR